MWEIQLRCLEYDATKRNNEKIHPRAKQKLTTDRRSNRKSSYSKSTKGNKEVTTKILLWPEIDQNNHRWLQHDEKWIHEKETKQQQNIKPAAGGGGVTNRQKQKNDRNHKSNQNKDSLFKKNRKNAERTWKRKKSQFTKTTQTKQTKEENEINDDTTRTRKRKRINRNRKNKRRRKKRNNNQTNNQPIINQ